MLAKLFSSDASKAVWELPFCSRVLPVPCVHTCLLAKLPAHSSGSQCLFGLYLACVTQLFVPGPSSLLFVSPGRQGDTKLSWDVAPDSVASCLSQLETCAMAIGGSNTWIA